MRLLFARHHRGRDATTLTRAVAARPRLTCRSPATRMSLVVARVRGLKRRDRCCTAATTTRVAYSTSGRCRSAEI